jgi:hypothetical protein
MDQFYDFFLNISHSIICIVELFFFIQYQAILDKPKLFFYRDLDINLNFLFLNNKIKQRNNLFFMYILMQV